MMTGDQYKSSLKDGRATYFEGRRIDDLPGHPILGVCVENVARGYDRLYQPGASAVSPLMQIPRSADDLRRHVPLLHEAGLRITQCITESRASHDGRARAKG
jgi:4-hydroxybutyryl-CoA dehydratase/vinylacetyl-CoA-Delta-isomerase